MRTTILLFLAAAPLLSLAAPLKRDTASSDPDIVVMQFAQVLEQLEADFYKQALSKFTADDITNAGFASSAVALEQFQNIMNDEATHEKFLSSSLPALGGSVIQGCTFNFDSVLTDVATMVATARVVENVGVGAYLGAAHLIKDLQVLDAAATIVTVESRHQTILNIMSGTSTAIPAAFDIPLLPNEVLAIAGSFVSGCDLGIPANKPLKVTNTAVATGTLLTVSADGLPSDTSNLHCHMLVGGAVNSISLPLNSCAVPENVNGPVALFVSPDPQPIANNVVLRDTSKLFGPTMLFVDAKSETLSQLVRPGSGGNSMTAASASGGSNSTSSNSDSTSSSGGPILTTGDGPDGAVSVNGWTNLPPSS